MALLLCFRAATGIGAILVAAFGRTRFDLEKPLVVSLAVIGAFILVQTLGSYLWARPYLADSPLADAEDRTAEPGANAYADAAKLAISTQGVVLGLISFTSSDAPSQTIKVGAASLAGGVLIASSLYLLVAKGPPPDHNRAFAASVMLIILLWLLAFGLLCVVASMWAAK